jgi:hypothetical protein
MRKRPALRNALGVAGSCLLLLAAGCGDDSSAKADSGSSKPDGAAPDAPADTAVPPDQGTSPLDGAPDRAADLPIVPLDASPIDQATPLDVNAQESGSPRLDGAGAETGNTDGGGSADGGGATPSCTSLPNPVFVLTGDTQVPILKVAGKALRAQTTPTTLVWFATGSCSIIDTLYSGGKMTANGSYIPADANWDATTGAVPTCTMPAGGVSPDLGIPIVYPDACSTDTPPTGLGAIKGPVQSMVFVAPTASAATAISAEEAYLVFGFGQNGQVSPWTNEAFYFIRPPTKGVQVSLGATLKVPAAKWKGVQTDKSTDVASKTASSTAPDQTIGILGTETFDTAANRAVLKVLTLQGYQQSLGYLPDSIASAFDKRNVRDGHYVAWSHVFYLTKVDGTGTPSNARVKTLVDIFTGGPGAASVGIDTIALAASKGLVPICAMTVQRATEGGDLATVAPADPCGCAYEAAVGHAPAACVACPADTQCTGGRCLHGYCEAADGRTSLADCTAPGTGYAGIINSTCTGRFTSAKRPMPALQQANGGTLPPLP